MALKNNKESLDVAAIKIAIDKINSRYGENTVFMAKQGLKPVEFISTGLSDLDTILGGGIPKGKISMLYGPEGAGKSSLCLHMLSKYHLSAYIDAERCFDEERADIFGIDLTRTIIVKPMSGEQALSAVIEFASAGVPLIVIDSIAALVPQKEFEHEEQTEKFAGMALTAGLLNRKVFAINNICDRLGTTVIFINQVRDNFGAMPFMPQDHIPGGHAIKHVCHVIFKIARRETLKVSNEAVGILCRVSTGIKNRSAAPFQECFLPLIFDKGFVSMDTYKEEMKLARKRSLALHKDKLQ